MPELVYRDLAEFGLPLVTPADPLFPTLLEDIRQHTLFQWSEEEDLEHAAVLVNRSGKAVLDFAVIWKSAGGGFKRFGPNPGALSRPLEQIRFQGILPGSKRLITASGVFGTNADVVPPEPHLGVMGGGGFGGRRPRGSVPLLLQLDVALFEDGLCAGPDECGYFEAATLGIGEQNRLCGEIAAMLRGGAGVGAVFEKLRPLARHMPSRGGVLRVDFQQNFARNAIHVLTQQDEGLISFFEQHAQPPRLRLHRPEQPPA